MARYDKVWELRRQDWSADDIARQVGLSRATVFRYLQKPTFPERQSRRGKGKSVLSPYKAYLVERWNDGCRTALRLFREIQAQGYTGSYNTVSQYTQRLRQAQGLPPRHRTPLQPRPEVVEPQTPALTPRAATWLILQRADKQAEDAPQQIAKLRGQHANLAGPTLTF